LKNIVRSWTGQKLIMTPDIYFIVLKTRFGTNMFYQRKDKTKSVTSLCDLI
jgi:hypothetical protein